MNKPYYVYIIEAISNIDGRVSLYTGITNNLQRRFKDHVAGRGAKYFNIATPRRFVYVELVGSKSDALKREYQVKQLSRKEKEYLISCNNFSLELYNV